MEYNKIKLQEPIYELQTDEKPKQHYFIDLYYGVEDDNIKNFAKSFHGLKKGQRWTYSGQTEILKFDPYSPSHLIKLFSCLQARTRRTAYWDSIFKSKREKRKKKITDFMDSFTDDLIDSTNELKVTDNEINYDDSRPHLKAQGKNHISSARKTNWEILKDLGDIEDPSKNINLNNDVTFTDKSNELFTDELEDYNIDEAYDEVTEDVDN